MVNVFCDEKENKTTLVLLLFFSAFALLIYYDSFFYGVSSYDDSVYFKYLKDLFGKEISSDTFVSIFSDYVNSNWHPVTILSMSVDYFVGDGDPVYFHITNSIIHVFNALLVYFVLYKLSKNKFASILTALIFTVHPLNVESVIWISERKGLLSTFFALYSLFFYISYKNKSIFSYKLLSIILFLFSLLSKPTTASMPFVFVFLDLLFFNAANKFSYSFMIDSIKDKLLYFIVIIFVISIAYLAQSETGALRDFHSVSFGLRIELSINNIYTYISKIFLPVNLAAYYPPQDNSLYKIIFYLIFSMIWLFFIVRYMFKFNVIIFCILFFLIQIIPMSGIFQTGGHSIALRYSYLPAIGILFIFSMMLEKIRNVRIYYTVALFVILFCIVISSYQTKVWKNHLSLWENNVTNVEPNYYSAYFYSFHLINSGRVSQASRYFLNLIGIKNNFYSDKAVSDIAIKLMLHEYYPEAKLILDKAIKYGIKGDSVLRERAILEYFHLNNKKAGLSHIKEALIVFPLNFEINRLYWIMLLEEGDLNSASTVLSNIKNIAPENMNIRESVNKLIHKNE